MSKVVRLRVKPSLVSRTRSRDEALAILLPKFLGVLWEKGKPGGAAHPGDVRAIPGDVIATIDSELGIGASVLGDGRFILHAYASTERVPWTKVFSIHLGDRSVVEDPRFFRHWLGHCGILTWKRGLWEDRIAALKVEPRTFAHLMTAGLTRSTQLN